MDWKARLFPPRTALTADLTTIDILKAAALVLMIIDHVGWLLLPQIEVLRAIGRWSAPLWFFLIGYARTRDVPNRWLIAGGILLVAKLLVGLPPLALSVLFTMAFVRLTMDGFWRYVEARPVYFWWFILLLAFFGYVTNLVVEYGTIGFLLACCGYAVRHREDVNASLGQAIQRTIPESLMIFVFVAYGLIEALIFGFSMFSAMVMAAGLLGMYFILQGFESRVLPDTSGNAQAPLVRFMGRYTLEIYVIHLLILMAVYGLGRLAGIIVY